MLNRVKTLTSKRKALTQKEVGLKYGFRSGLEESIAESLKRRGIDYRYEEVKLTYTTPPTPHTYTPDFVLPNGIIIETKGRFLPQDRKKHLLVKAQHPELDIRFVFSNSNARISKRSSTTYAKWCQQKGYLYADKNIPQEWLDEK